MGCAECGDKPEKKHFTNTVIEINNPEQLVLLRKVVIPASLGDEDDVPPAIGKYRNVILQYETNGHIYIYSSDGIPTSIESSGVPQDILDRLDDLEAGLVTEETERELADTSLSSSIESLSSSLSSEATARANADTALGTRIDTLTTNLATETNARQTTDASLQSQINGIGAVIPAQATAQNQLADKNFVNSSIATNTANFIGTFNSVAELEAYTGTVTNNDYAFVIVTDAQGNTAYDRYKYNGDTEQWMFEYELNNSSFTAVQWAAINSNITSGNVDKLTGLANIKSIGANLSLSQAGELSATNTTYTAGNGLSLTGTTFSADTAVLATQTDLTAGLATKQNTLTAGTNVQINNDTISATDTTYAAGTGLNLNGTEFSVDTTTIAEKTDIPNIVQTTGTSTTDVMSQNAVTSMVFADPATAQKIRIGNGATIDTNQDNLIAIGTSSNAYEDKAIAIGNNANATGSSSIAIGGSGTVFKTTASATQAIAIGTGAQASGTASVALGRGATASGDGGVSLGAYTPSGGKGVVNIGGIASTYYNNYGYNNSAYRLLTGLYDPQSAHDAANKQYVDNNIPATFTANEWNALWA